MENYGCIYDTSVIVHEIYISVNDASFHIVMQKLMTVVSEFIMK